MESKYVVGLIGSINEKARCFLNEELRRKNIDGIVSTHGSILWLLYENGGRVQLKDIALAIGRRKSTVTDLIKRLIELGYIEKKECECDGRSSYAVLTEKGYSLRKEYEEISVKLIDTCYEGFSDQEKEVLVKLLHKMHKNLPDVL